MIDPCLQAIHDVIMFIHLALGHLLIRNSQVHLQSILSFPTAESLMTHNCIPISGLSVFGQKKSGLSQRSAHFFYKI